MLKELGVVSHGKKPMMSREGLIGSEHSSSGLYSHSETPHTFIKELGIMLSNPTLLADDSPWICDCISANSLHADVFFYQSTTKAGSCVTGQKLE